MNVNSHLKHLKHLQLKQNENIEMTFSIRTFLFFIVLLAVGIRFYVCLLRAEKQFSHYADWAAKTPQFLAQRLDPIEGKNVVLLYEHVFMPGLHKEIHATLSGTVREDAKQLTVLDVSVVIRKRLLGLRTEIVVSSADDLELNSKAADHLYFLAKSRFPDVAIFRGPEKGSGANGTAESSLNLSSRSGSIDTPENF